MHEGCEASQGLGYEFAFPFFSHKLTTSMAIPLSIGNIPALNRLFKKNTLEGIIKILIITVLSVVRL